MFRRGILEQLGIQNPVVSPPTPSQPQETHEAPNDIIVFTDGSTIHNGRPNARGGYAVVFPNDPSYSCSFAMHEKGVTNNRAEYMAFIKALQIAETMDPEYHRRLVVYSDSNLLIQSVTQWLSGWKRNGWKKMDGKPVLNRDLLEWIDRLKMRRRLMMHHVEAHTGKTDWRHHWNNVADEMARNATDGEEVRGLPSAQVR